MNDEPEIAEESRTRRFVRALAWVVGTLGLSALIAIAATPELRSMASFALWRVRGENGTLYLAQEKGGWEMQHYVDGRRDGVWTTTDRDGKILWESEYRDDRPWNGICYIYPMKAWIGEYRNGKPWHGCLPQHNPVTRETDWLYFIGGKEVSYDEYCKEWGKSGPGHSFAGLGYLGQAAPGSK